MENNFTTEEIKYWLGGWYLQDGDGKRVGALSLETIIQLVDDEQDGIAAVLERKRLMEVPSDGI